MGQKIWHNGSQKTIMNRKYFSFKAALLNAVFLSAALIIISCAREMADQSTEQILAHVGNKTISVDEFVRRAELTIRPEYCRGNSEIHKRIILNSLIAEKLLALEAGEKNELTQNEQFEQHLKGIKEQAMRQWFYNHDFYEKVTLDTNEIKMAFKLYGRRYDIAYFTMKDSAVVRQVRNKLQQGLSFAEIFQQLEGQEEIPRREVSWNASEHEAIHTALFSEPLKKNQVIGPIKIENNFHTVIKVLGWIDQKVLSNSDVKKRLRDVKKKLNEKYASAMISEYTRKIMQGKRLNFSKGAFHELINIFYPVYMKSKKEGALAFKRTFYINDSNKAGPDDIEIKIEKLEDLPFLRIDDEIWTVGDFKKELISHPLVFRKSRISKSEFAGQFKLAVVDLIRDKYITKEAYKKGYDRETKVKRDASGWRDYYYSVYQRDIFLKSIGKKDHFHKDNLNIIEQDLNPYIDRLQEKYEDIIEIDTKLDAEKCTVSCGRASISAAYNGKYIRFKKKNGVNLVLYKIDR
jgi:hypothetical protein